MAFLFLLSWWLQLSLFSYFVFFLDSCATLIWFVSRTFTPFALLSFCVLHCDDMLLIFVFVLFFPSFERLVCWHQLRHRHQLFAARCRRLWEGGEKRKEKRRARRPRSTLPFFFSLEGRIPTKASTAFARLNAAFAQVTQSGERNQPTNHNHHHHYHCSSSLSTYVISWHWLTLFPFLLRPTLSYLEFFFRLVPPTSSWLFLKLPLSLLFSHAPHINNHVK